MLITLVLLAAGLAAASPVILNDSCSGQYRCDYTFSGVEVCDVYGWHKAATCKGQTCVLNAGNGIPYCNDP